jgi:hypothetical protein
MRWSVPSRVMPALLTRISDRAEIGFNPGDACLTGVEIGYIDLVDGDTGRLF